MERIGYHEIAPKYPGALEWFDTCCEDMVALETRFFERAIPENVVGLGLEDAAKYEIELIAKATKYVEEKADNLFARDGKVKLKRSTIMTRKEIERRWSRTYGVWVRSSHNVSSRRRVYIPFGDEFARDMCDVCVDSDLEITAENIKKIWLPMSAYLGDDDRIYEDSGNEFRIILGCVEDIEIDNFGRTVPRIIAVIEPNAYNRNVAEDLNIGPRIEPGEVDVRWSVVGRDAREQCPAGVRMVGS